MKNNQAAEYNSKLKKLADLCRRDYPNKFTKIDLFSQFIKLADTYSKLYNLVLLDFDRLLPGFSSGFKDRPTNCARCRKLTAANITNTGLLTNYSCSRKAYLGRTLNNPSDLKKTQLQMPQNAFFELQYEPKNCDKFENKYSK